MGNIQRPTQIEYDIDFPVTAQYTLHLRYSAQTARPVEILLDEKSLGHCCRTPTGGWNTSQAAWEETCRVDVTRGPHTVKLYSAGVFPHVVALRFDSPVAFPDGWKLRRLGCSQAPSASHRRRPLRHAIGDHRPDRDVRAAVPGGPGYLQRLDVLEEKLDAIPEGADDEAADVRQKLRRLAARGPAGQSAAGLRPAAAGQARRESPTWDCRATGRAIPACRRPASTTRSPSSRRSVPTAN